MRWGLLALGLVAGTGCELLLDTGAPDTGYDEDPCFASTTEGAGGQRVLAGGGALTAVWDGGAADFDNDLWLAEPDVVAIGTLHTTQPGAEVGLGAFSEGTELVFALTNPYGETYVTGPGDRNPDGEVHARVVDLGGGEYRVGFEDTANAGDVDYNDACFTVRGAVTLLGG